MDKIFCARCEDILPTLSDNSVNLIYTDPPYFKVKGEAWDHQWADSGKFIKWIGELCEEWQRVLAPNGSLYCFASPQMAARVEVKIAEYFDIINRITWRKPPFSTKAEMFRKEDLRSFFPASEALIFAEHHGSDNMAKGEAGYVAKCDELRGFLFEPLRAYLDGERKLAGIKREDCNAACGFARIAGGMASRHYFSSSQWCLPTEEHYRALQQLFNRAGGDYLKREYDDLKREYDDLRRPFSVSKEVPYTDVWDFPTVQYYKGKHPCEKPLDMHRHVIAASSRPGDVVLDCFGGSCKVADVCREMGRHYIIIESEEKYVSEANRRLATVSTQLSQFLITRAEAGEQ